MQRTLLSTLAAALLAIAALPATPALAQRVFVSAQGSDVNPCTFALPCRSFQHAHDTAAAGGEIDVLDPAGYGPLTINKAISIQGHGFSGISVASGGVGITILAGPNDAVNLNGLLIEGSGVGAAGIGFNSGKSLVVENCVVRNVTQTALIFASSATTLRTLAVSDSYFTDSTTGVAIFTQSSGAITASISRGGVYRNRIGLTADGSNGTGALNVAVTDSVVGNNSAGAPGLAIDIDSATGQSATSVVLTRAMIAGNTIGVRTFQTNATARLAQSTVTGNTTGFEIDSGSVIFSYGDNYIDGNGGNIGSLTSATKQ